MAPGRIEQAGIRRFDEAHLESQLVWIWSSPRSGSTWFLNLLSHPAKIGRAEPGPDDYLGFDLPPAWPGSLRLLPVPTTFVGFHFEPLVGGDQYREDFQPRTLRSALGNKASYLFAPQYSDVWMPEMRRLILARLNRMIEHAGDEYELDDPLVLIKEAGDAWSAPLVMSLFPRSRMIFLIRDGRDVIDSQIAGISPGGWFRESAIGKAMQSGDDDEDPSPEQRARSIRRRSEAWVGDAKSIGRAYEAHDPALRRIARYEDVLAEPAEQLRALNEWMQLKRSERWLERAVEANAFGSMHERAKGPSKFFRSASPGSWRGNLSEEERHTVNSIMGATLAEFGYEQGESGNRRA